ncbi:type VI secretion system Vgr family protein [Desulfovibrio inopinatus]|uniref:type VI secretion system Vgr family protein n=1 Tax=Desulfovibrio inopinatus TaxID=102109 RepID=UPI000420D7D3|nr:type VI secretion system tip protein TssI/VgrG [Desulfovibrio inopinatus]
MNQEQMATFTVEGQAPNTFEVVDFSGTDAISTPYRFTITLLSRDPDFKPSNMTKKGAKLTFTVGQSQNSYSGIVFEFKYLRTVDTVSFFRAILTPRMTLLTLMEHNQIFLQMTLPDILKQVFKDANLMHYEIRTYTQYPSMDYVCQYNETNFDFISRWMESRGLYYYFEEGDSGEVLIITDSKTAHTSIPGENFRYSPKSGLLPTDPVSDVFTFVSHEQVVPNQVVLKDYNYLKPTLELTAKATVSEDGAGIRYHYGDNYQTLEEGNALAKIRSEALLCEGTTYHGESGCLMFRAGGLFTLKMHPYSTFNTAYLLTSITHSGRNTAYLNTGIPKHGQTDVATKEKQAYRNTFSAVDSQLQYRPPLRTERAKFHGVINAFVDGSGSGEYATVDEMGRYKVKLPFDLAGKPNMEASWWFRLAEPYSGAGYGIHFPLLKDTEVLLTFIDGNPDRPVISSAVYNGDLTNPISNKNQALNVIRTKGRNQIVMGDKKGNEFMGLWSPYHNSGIAIGSIKPGGGGSVSVQTAGDYETAVVGAENKFIWGGSNEIVAGVESKITAGSTAEIGFGLSTDIFVGGKLEYMKGPGLAVGDEMVEMHGERAVNGIEELTLKAGIPNSKAVLSGLNTSWHAIIAAFTTVAANIGITAASLKGGDDGDEADNAQEFFSQLGNAMKDNKAVTSVVPLEIVGSLVGAFIGLNKTNKKIEDAFADNAVSTIEMKEGGIEIGVKSAIQGTEKIELKVSNKAPATPFSSELDMTTNTTKLNVVHSADSTSTFEINDAVSLNTSGPTITISKTTGGSLTLNENGGVFEKADNGQVSINNDSVTVEKPQLGKLSLTGASSSLEHGETGGGLTLSKTEASLLGPGASCKVSVTRSNIKLETMSHAGSITIDSAGRISLG